MHARVPYGLRFSSAPSIGLCHGAQHWDVMSPGQKEMLKKACEVECPSVETWEDEATAPGTATATRLLEGTAGMSTPSGLPGFVPILPQVAGTTLWSDSPQKANADEVPNISSWASEGCVIPNQNAY